MWRARKDICLIHLHMPVVPKGTIIQVQHSLSGEHDGFYRCVQVHSHDPTCIGVVPLGPVELWFHLLHLRFYDWRCRLRDRFFDWYDARFGEEE